MGGRVEPLLSDERGGNVLSRSCRVKICCITSVAEAELAIQYGADALGFVSKMPSGTGIIPDERIREIAREVPRGVRTFLLTSDCDPESIARQHAFSATTSIQLVDRMTAMDLGLLRALRPTAEIVQVVHVEGSESIPEAEEMAEHADLLLLDSGQPDAARRTLGGTGEVHDWETSAEIVRRVRCPVFLAGGLGPDNVAEAIRRVRPHGVDVCSRLRPGGQLDEEALAHFFESVRTEAAD